MMFWRRPTGRSDVIAQHGVVATSQPLASQAGLRILRSGGNAVDAAVAAAAVLDVVEPFSTGCGGDAFALLHLPDAKHPLSFNGSGRSGSGAILDELLEKGWNKIPYRGGPPVTVPGAMHLWCHLVEKYGQLEMKEVFKPAIEYARNGFPVSPIIAEVWAVLVDMVRNNDARNVFTINGRSPEPGEIMKNKDLAKVFEEISESGVETFYKGRIAESIVNTVQENGGFLTLDDLAAHSTQETTAISTEYRGVDVFECPPNGQGFAALIMLKIMEEFDFSQYSQLGADRYHAMIEAKKLGYADLYQHNADPDFYNVPLTKLLSKEYAERRADIINMDYAMQIPSSGIPIIGDTIYLATADEEGRAVSFINSLYMGLGSGLVAKGTGIKLQNRGSLFSLDPAHPNCYVPRKLPFHTIIPGALYKDQEFWGVFGIMGGAHQAQAHAQFVSHLVDYNMSPQHALDHPRYNHNQDTNTVALENGIPADVQGELRKRGHSLIHESMSQFGGGQAILRLRDVWIAGSDFRKDGQAAGY